MKRFRNILTLTAAVTAIAVLAAHTKLGAADPAPATVVIYKASGTFATPAVSGADQLQLAGQPFILAVYGNPAATPSQQGSNWGIFTPVDVRGSVYSGAAGVSVPITSKKASIELAVASTEDLIHIAFPFAPPPPVPNLTIKAMITLPSGTLTNFLIHPFSQVSLDPSNATISYSATSPPATTVLAVQTGTLQASASSGTGGTSSIVIGVQPKR